MTLVSGLKLKKSWSQKWRERRSGDEEEKKTPCEGILFYMLPAHPSLRKTAQDQNAEDAAQKTPPKSDQTLYVSFFFSFILVKQYLSVEHMLKESGISVAPPLHHSHCLVPQVPDQGPNLESRQCCASEVLEL